MPAAPVKIFQSPVVNDQKIMTLEWRKFITSIWNALLTGAIGFGTGTPATPVTTTTKGAGDGPTTPETVVQYQQVSLNGETFYIPLMQ